MCISLSNGRHVSMFQPLQSDGTFDYNIPLEQIYLLPSNHCRIKSLDSVISNDFKSADLHKEFAYIWIISNMFRFLQKLNEGLLTTMTICCQEMQYLEPPTPGFFLLNNNLNLFRLFQQNYTPCIYGVL